MRIDLIRELNDIPKFRAKPHREKCQEFGETFFPKTQAWVFWRFTSKAHKVVLVLHISPSLHVSPFTNWHPSLKFIAFRVPALMSSLPRVLLWTSSLCSTPPNFRKISVHQLESAHEGYPPLAAMPSNLSENDKEIVKRTVPKPANKIQAVAIARLYIAYPDRQRWIYTGLQGAVVLTNDLVGNTFWIKMVDVSVRYSLKANIISAWCW